MIRKTKGKIAAFFSISLAFPCLIAYIFHYLPHGREYFVPGGYFLAVVNEQNVCPGIIRQEFFLKPVAFSDSSSDQIPFHGPLEHPFRDRYHYPAESKSVVFPEAIPYVAACPELAFLKKGRNVFLHMQPLVFGQQMPNIFSHLLVFLKIKLDGLGH